METVWQVGGDDYEEGVARQLVDGGLDLALTGAKGLPAAGISQLDALLAPYLITTDALAVAVAISPVADDMLEAMAAGGAVGLAMWPADLGHPVAFETCTGGPLLEAADFAGLTIRSIPNWVVDGIFETLGADPLFVNNWDDEVGRCEIDAAESSYRRSLSPFSTFTGDMTFNARYHVLAANADSFATLTDEQRATLREAARAVRDTAIAELPGDATGASDWCASGGRVVLAGPDALAGLQAAAMPVLEQLRSDPSTAKSIDRIMELSSQVPPGSIARACDPPTPAAAPDTTTGFNGNPLPDGTYRIEVSRDDLTQAGASPRFTQANGDSIVTLTVAGDGWTGSQAWGSRRVDCGGTIVPVDAPAQRFTTVYDGGCGFDYDIVWQGVPDGLVLHVVAVGGDPDWPDMVSERALNDRVWVRID
jgi:TRAP-type C4-dicarboxylate transport system substrate-binding protein